MLAAAAGRGAGARAAAPALPQPGAIHHCAGAGQVRRCRHSLALPLRVGERTRAATRVEHAHAPPVVPQVPRAAQDWQGQDVLPHPQAGGRHHQGAARPNGGGHGVGGAAGILTRALCRVAWPTPCSEGEEHCNARRRVPKRKPPRVVREACPSSVVEASGSVNVSTSPPGAVRAPQRCLRPVQPPTATILHVKAPCGPARHLLVLTRESAWSKTTGRGTQRNGGACLPQGCCAVEECAASGRAAGSTLPFAQIAAPAHTDLGDEVERRHHQDEAQAHHHDDHLCPSDSALGQSLLARWAWHAAGTAPRSAGQDTHAVRPCSSLGAQACWIRELPLPRASLRALIAARRCSLRADCPQTTHGRDLEAWLVVDSPRKRGLLFQNRDIATADKQLCTVKMLCRGVGCRQK